MEAPHTSPRRRPFSGRDLVREKVRIRDNHTCQHCGKKWEEGTRRFDVHHTNGECGYNSRGYDRVANMPVLTTLCHECHYNAHDFNGNRDKPDLKPGTNLVKYRGRTRTVREWCQALGLDKALVMTRIKNGCSAHEAFYGRNPGLSKAA